MSQLLDQLNPEQRAAVEATEGPLLILAGAGSGKTRVITYRIAHLIESCHVPPASILAVTFTNKAADQMKARVAALLAKGEDGPGTRAWPHISTFHSFSVRVLRHDINRLGYTRDFSIYDDDDQLRMVKACLTELGLADRVLAPRGALSQISYAKNHAISPEQLYQQAKDIETEKLASVYDLYQKKLRQSNALDFDDLLLKMVELLEEETEVREWYNQRFRYIHVDEYQDTNRIQYRLIRALTHTHQNICAVGDEDQSIYKWRGATIENILNFEEDYPTTHIVRLEQNYRSTQLILDAATAVVSRNLARKGKTLWTERGAGARPSLYEAETAEEEGMFIAAEVRQALDASEKTTVGVLYRTNAQSRILEEAMRASRIDYRLVGGFSFYARAEVRDVLAYARLAANLRDSASFERIVNTPPRGIGDTTLSLLKATAREQKLTLWEALEATLAATAEARPPLLADPSVPAAGIGALGGRALRALVGFHKLISDLAAERDRRSMSDLFKSILERSRYLKILEAENSPDAEGRIENLKELVNAAATAEEQGETLAEFLDRAALVSDADDFDERARVTLMTLHSAKGLEFSTVFLTGMEEGLLPHFLAAQSDADVEEERRLCYVGMTRAQDRLVLTRAQARRSFGQESRGGTRLSRFLREIPPELLDRASSTVPKPRRVWQNALNSPGSVDRALRERGFPARGGITFAAPHARGRWPLGTRVRHAKYGVGVVVECEPEGPEAKVTVSFPGYGAKKLVEHYAGLEKA
ncbi:MAG TPA: UvrD-helicase domain-containing protein [Terriglobia bacterium]|nr:UvrD-helicase domain-containing protein [Terriglobia bacterium]